MRKAFVILALCSLFIACGGEDTNTAGDKKPESTAATTNNDAELEKGLEMIGANDCTTCHRIDEKNIGPAYTEVAKKYENTPANVDSLATKVIKGGSGVWGEIPMTEHPTLSMDSARTMIKYILSLRNK